MNNSKTISALNYLSALILPIIVPAIIYFVMKENEEIRYHSKRAFWSQFIPYATATIIFIVLIIWNITTDMTSDLAVFSVFGFAFIYIVIFFILSIWSIFQVVKLMRDV